MHESCHWFEHGDYCLHSRLPHLLAGAAGTSKESCHGRRLHFCRVDVFSKGRSTTSTPSNSNYTIEVVDSQEPAIQTFCTNDPASAHWRWRRIAIKILLRDYSKNLHWWVACHFLSLNLCRSSGLLQEPGFELHYWSCGLAGASHPGKA